MGFEPTASTLRRYGSQLLSRPFPPDFPGNGVSIPSGSLTIPPLPSDKVTEGHASQARACPRQGLVRDVRSACSRNAQRMAVVPLGRRSRSSASNGTSPTREEAVLIADRPTSHTELRIWGAWGSRVLLATTRATRDQHRFCRSRPLRRSPRSMRRARVRQPLRHTSTVPEATRIGRVVPTRGNHLDRAAGGDIATARRHEALYSHGSTPHRRRVALLRDLLMIPRPYPTAPFRRWR
jgi:hypothetical protein